MTNKKPRRPDTFDSRFEVIAHFRQRFMVFLGFNPRKTDADPARPDPILQLRVTSHSLVFKDRDCRPHWADVRHWSVWVSYCPGRHWSNTGGVIGDERWGVRSIGPLSVGWSLAEDRTGLDGKTSAEFKEG